MALFEEMKHQGNWLFRYRGILPLIILAITLFVYLQELYDGFIPVTHERGDIWLVSVSFFGLLIRVMTVGYAPKNTSGRNTVSQVADVVNTKGFYSMVRHPLYLGNFLMWLGLCLLTRDIDFIFFFTAIYWLYYERIMLAEEEYLRGKFGAEYELWASTTPAFIPAPGKFIKSESTFNWRKVIKSEKSGLFALAVVFALFEITADIVTAHRLVVHLFWLIPLVVAALFYLTVKFLSKYQVI